MTWPFGQASSPWMCSRLKTQWIGEVEQAGERPVEHGTVEPEMEADDRRVLELPAHLRQAA